MRYRPPKKTVIMKKILLTFAIIVTSILTANAQNEKGEVAGGVNILYGTEVANIGVGIKARYSFTNEFRGEATFDYFFKRKNHTLLDGNLNIQYLLPIGDSGFTIYPLAGVGLGNDHHSGYEEIYYEGDQEKRRWIDQGINQFIIGINAGCGAEYAVTKKAAITFEARYQFFNHHCTQLLLGLGLVHKF